MRKIDAVEKPKCVWYEDEDGNVYDIDDWHDPLWSIEKIKKDSGGKAIYQVSRFLERRHTFRCDPYPGNFIYRLVDWMIPTSWKKRGAKAWSFTGFDSSSDWPIIKYLVDIRDWEVDDAIMLSSDLCGRCSEILRAEAKGDSVPKYQIYNRHQLPMLFIRDRCDRCKEIRPREHQQEKMLSAYRAYASGQTGERVVDAYNMRLSFSVLSEERGWDVVRHKLRLLLYHVFRADDVRCFCKKIINNLAIFFVK